MCDAKISQQQSQSKSVNFFSQGLKISLFSNFKCNNLAIYVVKDFDFFHTCL